MFPRYLLVQTQPRTERERRLQSASLQETFPTYRRHTLILNTGFTVARLHRSVGFTTENLRADALIKRKNVLVVQGSPCLLIYGATNPLRIHDQQLWHFLEPVFHAKIFPPTAIGSDQCPKPLNHLQASFPVAVSFVSPVRSLRDSDWRHSFPPPGRIHLPRHPRRQQMARTTTLSSACGQSSMRPEPIRL